VIHHEKEVSSTFFTLRDAGEANSGTLRPLTWFSLLGRSFGVMQVKVAIAVLLSVIAVIIVTELDYIATSSMIAIILPAMTIFFFIFSININIFLILLCFIVI
jgi:hypothetical protein